ncbi:FKBP-type peptidyl-prolyl cis-trans isomerase SlyD [termite gut metagenome]|uniref:peptidylprolyl isomerase n=1 Tax=termite gut metagenome TaxID=433724 RepID=A0A5J4R3Z0_9ZZZZ
METANKYITVSYKLYTTEDGEKDLIEETTTNNPFQFITGVGTTLEAFEDQIKNLNKGDTFEFTIPYAEAYGEYNDDHVIDLPKNMFEVDGRFDAEAISEGKIVPLLNADGQRLSGVVVEVQADTVIVDMNHPLAGEDLTFVGEVVESRAATDKEVQDMIDAMNCDGGCEGCGDGCDEGCECEHCH